jgi:hypothetical protein
MSWFPPLKHAHVKRTVVILTLKMRMTNARAVDDPELSQQILANAAAALKQRIPN